MTALTDYLLKRKKIMRNIKSLQMMIGFNLERTRKQFVKNSFKYPKIKVMQKKKTFIEFWKSDFYFILKLTEILGLQFSLNFITCRFANSFLFKNKISQKKNVIFQTRFFYKHKFDAKKTSFLNFGFFLKRLSKTSGGEI